MVLRRLRLPLVDPADRGGTLDEIVRKVLLTYWNTVSFLMLYANAGAAQGSGVAPGDAAGAATARRQAAA